MTTGALASMPFMPSGYHFNIPRAAVALPLVVGIDIKPGLDGAQTLEYWRGRWEREEFDHHRTAVRALRKEPSNSAVGSVLRSEKAHELVARRYGAIAAGTGFRLLILADECCALVAERLRIDTEFGLLQPISPVSCTACVPAGRGALRTIDLLLAASSENIRGDLAGGEAHLTDAAPVRSHFRSLDRVPLASSPQIELRD